MKFWREFNLADYEKNLFFAVI